MNTQHLKSTLIKSFVQSSVLIAAFSVMQFTQAGATVNQANQASQAGHANQASQDNRISHGTKLANDARKQIGVTISYDPAYRALDFPRGDVDPSTGVCTDVVVRAYRLQNIDLQQLVNHDMKNNWSAYPKLWGLKSTDRNIDHRRVPNLEVFFQRHGQTLSTTDKSSFKAGDIVSWRLPGNNLPHIGIVSDNLASDGTPLIIHNIGQGTREENVLYRFPIKGHFRY